MIGATLELPYTVFERLGNTMVDRHMLALVLISRSPLQIRSNDSQGQCLSDNTIMPCSTIGHSLAQWA